MIGLAEIPAANTRHEVSTSSTSTQAATSSRSSTRYRV